MKIVSKFYDYYDCAGKMDFSNYPLYVRKEEEIVYEHKKSYPEELRGIEISVLSYRNNHFDTGVVLFCGKRYLFLKDDGKCFYTIESAIKNLQKKIALQKENAEEKNKNFYIKLWEEKIALLSQKGDIFNYYILSQKSWQRLVERAQVTSSLPTADDAFRHFKCPVMMFTSHPQGYLLVKNPLLRKLNFMSVMDPQTAYQEISMYLGNILVEQKDPIVQISDELKAQSKGFDKWSFRKKVR